MSRFGLRSKSDGMKMADEKRCAKKFTDSAGKVASKKFNNNNNNNSGSSSTNKKKTNSLTSSLHCGTSNAASAQTMPISIVCSVPLSRLSGIIEKITANATNCKSNANVDSQHHESDATDEGSFKEPNGATEHPNDQHKHTPAPSTATQLVKVLCLYCDKKFSSLKLQLKHVEKFHIQQTDRRSSGRNSQSNEASTPTTKEYRASQTTTTSTTLSMTSSTTPSSTPPTKSPKNAFPGCTFCKKTKGHQIAGPVNNLESLFQHLTDYHADKYHGCKLCMVRFQSVNKLAKHMQTAHNTSINAKSVVDSGSVDNTEPDDNYEKLVAANDTGKSAKTRLQKLQKSTSAQTPHNNNNNNNNTSSCNSSSSSSNSSCNSSSSLMTGSSSTSSPQTLLNDESLTIMGAEETILSRLGLTQNRLPNKRKGVRQRRESLSSSSATSLLPSPLLKSEQATTFASTLKIRNKTTKSAAAATNTDTDVVFRVPTRTEVLSCAFDEDFYKDVISNVRTNLMHHLDGKLECGAVDAAPATNSLPKYPTLAQIRSSLVKSPPRATTAHTVADSELHAATSLPTSTAFPTLLTAEQYGGDVLKIRRPHTKHSWKWKWDSVKKFKIINEGGKMIKKVKQPMSGLRDLSKLDMWTQLTMRQKHEQYVQQADDAQPGGSALRVGKQRQTDQLNFILDMRLLPNITLEQNEQTFIKVEHDYGDDGGRSHPNDRSSWLSTADSDFLSMLQLGPYNAGDSQRSRLVLSGEWARPRCYLCMCCGAKFEKLKSLEEHKIFRHPNILSTHYELVGRELLTSNLMQHLFLPKRALHRYTSRNDELERSPRSKFTCRKSHFNVPSSTSTTVEDESSDSTQSLPNSSTMLRTYVLKNSGGGNSNNDEFDGDMKNSTLDTTNTTTSPTHSLQSSSSSLLTTPVKRQQQHQQQPPHSMVTSCTKCNRKCNGTLDLYRHILDCSGDYIWSMAKKRKYRYYCGSKRRRPCNKHHFSDYRRNKRMVDMKAPAPSEANDAEDGALGNSNTKPKTSPRQRPSDAESIKKMLENLPPKRVCKKIFPTLTKAKKARKSKLMAKHQLYKTQVLRKTRSRQISQAASMLRSKQTSNASGRNKVLRNVKTNATRKIVSASASQKLAKDDVKADSVKTKSSPETSSATKKTDQNSESNMCHNETPTKQPKNAARKLAASPAHKANDDVVIAIPQESEQEKPKVSLPVEAEKKSPESSPKSLSANITAIQPTVVATTGPTNTPTKTNDVQKSIGDSINSNSAKKRSKKINDCIAMLTGKLEEKLKTEQTVVAAKDGDVPTEPQQQISPPEKKTPKRKTLSRRFIKPTVTLTSEEEEPTMPMSTNAVVAAFPTAIQTCTNKATETKATIPVPPPPPQPALPLPLPPPKESVPTKPMPNFEKLSAKDVANNVVLTPTSNTMIGLPNLILNASLNPPPDVILKAFAIPGGEKALLNASQNVLLKPNNHAIPPTPPGKYPLSTTLNTISKVTHESPAIPVPVNPLPKIPVFKPANNAVSCMLPALPLHALEVNQTKLIPPQVAQSIAITVTAAEPQAPPQPPNLPIIPPPSALAQQLTTTAVPTVPVASVAPQPFNVEPLNLSNVKSVHKSPDAPSMPRPGIPARRKTICGFELPNAMAFNDMEPLDLSYKSRKPLAAAMPPTVFNNSNNQALQLTTQQPTVSVVAVPLGNSVDASLAPGVAAKPIALAMPCDAGNKQQFYSNLDLLKIPQVRNPSLAGPTATDLLNLNTKCSPVKKRNVKELPTVLAQTPSVQTAAAKAPVKEALAFNKKENNAKNKPILKMDEEVINHIDDAINSVVNAVQASLDENEKLNPLPETTSPNVIVEPSTLQKVPVVIATAVPTTALGDSQSVQSNKTIMMPQKRLVRSKTLDCRPAFMAVNMLDTPTVVEELTKTTTTTTTPIKTIAQQLPAPIVPNVVCTPVNNNIVAMSDQCDTIPAIAFKEQQPVEQEPNKVELKEPKEVSIESLQTADDKNEESNKLPQVPPLETLKSEDPPTITPEQVKLPAPVVMPVIEANEPKHPISNTVVENTCTTNNKTAAELPTAAEEQLELNVTADPKKKTRRRRKNELAAIVADQLLESFKIDKARRDNLKKLENLAYEKSEDLLLTGMLLMSSTKRNASSGGLYNSGDGGKDIDRGGTSSNNNKAISAAETTETTNRNVKKPPNDKQQKVELRPSVEIKEKVPDVRRSKRRQCRRKGNIIDNENISKLKSSLESFSIGIEKQLSEIEAKNANLYNKEGGGADGSGKPNAAHVPVVVKPPILRPSILSATLDQPPTTPQQPPSLPSNKLADNKSVASSRDPRLNKNIHKDAVAPSEILTRTRLKSLNEKNLEEMRDFEEDNYLTEIAKNVNEKIMSAENEDFMFANDGFEMVSHLQNDDSNSKYYRPPTSMSVRSAPNFDERSNYGSICDENTNTEVMDMDLDDDLSVYTSYSQDIGRGRGRRRRRRRSILLKRKPKKRPNPDMPTETFECTLCKKTFYAANSLSKHNMTLAHVSKVSEQEYLQSKSMNAIDMMSYTKHTRVQKLESAKPPKAFDNNFNGVNADDVLTNANNTTAVNTISLEAEEPNEQSLRAGEAPQEKVTKTNAQRLNLNPDERLFFECCTILKGASDTNTHVNNSDTGGGTLSYTQKDKQKDEQNGQKLAGQVKRSISETATMSAELLSDKEVLAFKAVPAKIVQPTVYRDSQAAKQPSNRITTSVATITNNTNLFASNYSAISQFSGVTNTTTSRFKTKAAMKGYENMNVDLSTIQQEYETKSTTVCKLTELAEIALEQDKPPPPLPPSLSPVYQPSIPTQPCKQLTTTHGYVSLSLADNHAKNPETQSSTSSKTIMHSSKIKAAVQEHNNTTPGKIIIPERPFKNIGLEEKESITFQKPKTTTLNLTLNDDNSVSTVSYSDRDDFDFGLLSCDEENSIKTSNEKTINKNTSDSSSSSRATAKTFENKSLIMGRIFKNASSKGKTAVKVKSVGIQKDTPPKADINQLFDELRGDGAIAAAAIQVEMPVQTARLAPIIAPTAPIPIAVAEPVASGSARVHETEGFAQRMVDGIAVVDECVFAGNTKQVVTTPAAFVNNTKLPKSVNQLPEPIQAVNATASAGKVVRPPKEKVKKLPGKKKKSKDITKLQSELGMSPAEIEKLIDDGQRKSKRRCATNRPKKLVEMWSSDEYEEFLSTKDIIALIEEKEKREQRKKRKNSVSQANYVNQDSKDKYAVMQHTNETQYSANKKRNARAMSVVNKSEEVPQVYESTEKKKRKSRTPDRQVEVAVEEPATPFYTKPAKNNAAGAKKSTKNKTANAATATTARTRRVTETKTKQQPDTQLDNEAGLDIHPTTAYKPKKSVKIYKELPQPTARSEEYEFGGQDYEESVPRPRRNKIKNKKDELNSGLNGQLITKDPTRAVLQSKESLTKERAKGSSNLVNPNKKVGKGKRKNPTNQSSPRKKRLASEKLYYWSSSSDEDFGRINNQSADEFESREPHQQHGWIVGDSHKKIVTLLAIAKGNKRGRKKKQKFK